MKITKENIPFAQIANAVLFDKKLSWKAKGLFSYMFAKPEDWDFSSRRIKDDATDGYRSTLSGLKELESTGYLSRARSGTGRMEYTLKYSVKPLVRKPHSAKTHSAETAPVSNTEEENNKEKKQTMQNLKKLSEMKNRTFRRTAIMR